MLKGIRYIFHRLHDSNKYNPLSTIYQDMLDHYDQEPNIDLGNLQRKWEIKSKFEKHKEKNEIGMRGTWQYDEGDDDDDYIGSDVTKTSHVDWPTLAAF